MTTTETRESRKEAAIEYARRQCHIALIERDADRLARWRRELARLRRSTDEPPI